MNYELRQYDGRLARWHNPDPLLQHYSPYVAMGNDPVNRIDPTGGIDYYIDGMKVPSGFGSRMMNERTNILHIDAAMDEMGMFDIGAEIYGVKFFGGEQANYAAGELEKLIRNSERNEKFAGTNEDGNFVFQKEQIVGVGRAYKKGGKTIKVEFDYVDETVEVIVEREDLFKGFKPTKTATHDHFVFQNEEDEGVNAAASVLAAGWGIAVAEPSPFGEALMAVGTAGAVGVYGPGVIDAVKTTLQSGGDQFYYVTYTKTHPSGKVYVGRTSGYGNPINAIKARDSNHHMNSFGYGPAVLSSFSPAQVPGGYATRATDPAYWFIRGSEQLQIEQYRKMGVSGNSINGIGPNNPNINKYINEALKYILR